MVTFDIPEEPKLTGRQVSLAALAVELATELAERRAAAGEPVRFSASPPYRRPVPFTSPPLPRRKPTRAEYAERRAAKAAAGAEKETKRAAFLAWVKEMNATREERERECKAELAAVMARRRAAVRREQGPE